MTNSHGVRPSHSDPVNIVGKVRELTQQMCEGEDRLDVQKASFAQISMHFQPEMRVGRASCPNS